VQVVGEKIAFTGTLRVYVAEPVSRWNHNDGQPYDHGFLNYGYFRQFTVVDGAVYEDEVTWTSSTYALSAGNIEIIAVVFDTTWNQGDADPPNGAYFDAYYAVATALATPSQIGQNSTSGGYTHTVFVEEGTATWCGYCPYVREALEWLHRGRNFHYVALVSDKNPLADNRLDDTLAITGYPTTYLDGGYRVAVGGYSDTTAMRNYIGGRIDQCGGRYAPGLALLAKLTFIDQAHLKIRLAVGNGVAANSAPNTPVITAGPATSYPDSVCSFTALGTDASAPQALEYQWNYGDGDTTVWLGPYNPGVSCSRTHSYGATGDYEVKVRTRDPWAAVSTWSLVHTVEVVSPSCCVPPTVGNVDESPDNLVTMGDLTVLIDHLFISFNPVACLDEANIDMSSDGLVTMGDLTVLIDHLFISFTPLPACPF
jgi:hypothetical protein